MKTVLFYRNFQGLTGGHLKVWDYFNHVLASRDYSPYIYLSPQSKRDRTNPWLAYPERILTQVERSPDALFLAGLDWQGMSDLFSTWPEIPVLNLIQGFRHIDPHHPCSSFLQYPAIRICVSEALKQVVKGKGPVVLIPNGLDLQQFTASANRDIDLLIVAYKQPQLGGALGDRLKSYGRVQVLDQVISRPEFLNYLHRSVATVFLPLPQEGFYLPALEGMAAGTLVICPDCLGNRSFCLDGITCITPAYNLEAICKAVTQISQLPLGQILAAAKQMVAKHDLMTERQTFTGLLADLEQLWKQL